METSSSTEAEEFAAVQTLSSADQQRLRTMIAKTSKDINDEWFELQDWGLA